MLTAFDIAVWMDDDNFRLIECFNQPTVKGFHSQENFLTQLSEYAGYIDKSPISGWNHINFSRCIKGLKGLDASKKEVQSVLSALANKIENPGCALDAQAIGNSLYGLQNMDANSEAVQRVLLALVEKIKASTCKLDAQEIGNSLYGLQSMDASSEVVQGVLLALVEKIKASNCALKAQHISNSLYGLQKMSLSCPGVHPVLCAIERKMFSSDTINIEHFSLEWCQSVSSYLCLAENNPQESINSSVLKYFFPDVTSYEMSALKKLFVDDLKNKCVKGNSLDLHGLDHLSARFLLAGMDVSSDKINQMICGRGSHSKIAHRNTMRCILKEYIEKHKIIGSWSEDSGRFDISRDFSNKPVGRQGFFENKQPIFDVHTISISPTMTHPFLGWKQEVSDYLHLAEKNNQQTIPSQAFKKFFPDSSMKAPYKVSDVKKLFLKISNERLVQDVKTERVGAMYVNSI